MHSNIKRNFWMPSSSGDAIILCRLLWWGVESNYSGAPSNVVVKANVIALPYNAMALAWMFHA
jgi:hypothetical protein